MFKLSSIVMLLFMTPSSIFPSKPQSIIQRDGQVEEGGRYNNGKMIKMIFYTAVKK